MAHFKDRRKPYGPLMVEHRIIETAVKTLNREVERLKKGGEPDFVFIKKIVDFFRTYADKCHHGKEEDILFDALKKKDISEKHKEILQRLLDEHDAARAMINLLDNTSKKTGKENIMKYMRFLAWLYPKHIELEDNHFFVPVMDYFTEEEQYEMVEKFFDFDRKQIHEKYRQIAKEMEKR